MNKQERINGFLSDFADFLERYYSSAITEVVKEPQENWIKIRIAGPQGASMELWSDGGEVTVIFGESHWHIDSYDTPCNFENIFENTVDSVIDILRFKTSTYSCWHSGKTKGGASCAQIEIEDVIAAARKVFKEFDEIRVQTWATELKTIRVQPEGGQHG